VEESHLLVPSKLISSNRKNHKHHSNFGTLWGVWEGAIEELQPDIQKD
jgi:hypothetical protein